MFNKHYFNLIKITLVVITLLPLNVVLAKKLLDPTRPPGATTHQNSSSVKKLTWHLTSTLIASERKVATINGKLIRQGEQVNGARLIDIQAWNVTLLKNNKTFKVYLFEGTRVRKNNR